MGKTNQSVWLVIPDLHFRFHDPRFTDLILKILKIMAKRKGFAGVVQLGDFVDLWQVSEYDKDPERRETVLDDLLLYASWLDKAERLLPKKSVWHQLEGNHEKRITKFTGRRVPEVYKLMKTIPEVLGFPGRNLKGLTKWVWHPYTKWDSCRISDTVFHHGFYFSTHVAAKNLSIYPANFVCGHVHRVQYVSNGAYFSATLGHGSDPRQTMHMPTPTTWQQALGIFYAGTKATKDHLEILPVEAGSTILWGERL